MRNKDIHEGHYGKCCLWEVWWKSFAWHQRSQHFCAVWFTNNNEGEGAGVEAASVARSKAHLFVYNCFSFQTSNRSSSFTDTKRIQIIQIVVFVKYTQKVCNKVMNDMLMNILEFWWRCLSLQRIWMHRFWGLG